MGLFSKKEKKELEPQYYLSATNVATYNYKVYYMSKLEKILYFLAAFVVGAAVGYIFYGGLAKDQFGDPTRTTWILNIVISSITGVAAGFMFLPIRTKQIINNKKNNLKLQFRELLDALATSIGSGKNVTDSVKAARDDLAVIYSDETDIIKELDIIIFGISNNIEIERSLQDLGLRSGVDDIMSFADVFETCYRKGGDIKEVIKNTQQIITEKMEVEQQIMTIVAGSKNEQTIMMFMPIGLVAVMKMMSPDFANNFASPAGILATTFAIGLFVASYFVGNIVLDIKV